MPEPVEILMRAADRLDKLLTEVSPGPWFYDSYSRVYSQPKVLPYDQWTDGTGDHTLDRYGRCPDCPEVWRDAPPSPGLGHGCRLAVENYTREPMVASVMPIAGDTAHGHRKCDAEWLATMNPIVGRHLVTILRGTAELSRETGLVGEPLLALAYAVLDEQPPASHLRAEEAPNV